MNFVSLDSTGQAASQVTAVWDKYRYLLEDLAPSQHDRRLQFLKTEQQLKEFLMPFPIYILRFIVGSGYFCSIMYELSLLDWSGGRVLDLALP